MPRLGLVVRWPPGLESINKVEPNKVLPYRVELYKVEPYKVERNTPMILSASRAHGKSKKILTKKC
jgi:hypothetical protein